MSPITKQPTRPKPTSTAEYLATLAPAQRAVLEAMREAIRAGAPDAGDGFSYGMPAVTHAGKPVLWYAAWKTHYALYPVGAAMLESLGAEAARYETAKGTIRFPAAEPVPYDLVTKLAAVRLAQVARE